VNGFQNGTGANQDSIHFLIGKGAGQIVQFVDTDERANHVVLANTLYIGIEFETQADKAGEAASYFSSANRVPFTGEQRQAGRDVISWICDNHGIPYVYPDPNPTGSGHHNPAVQKLKGHWHGILSHGHLEDVLGNNHSDIMLEEDLVAMGVILQRPPKFGAGQCW
jgi:hypothetical protein